MGLGCGFTMGMITRGAILILLMKVMSHSFTSVEAARIIVGDSNNWRFGFNYTDWARKTAPFYQNDTLVFRYDPPNSTFAHSVYLLKNLQSFTTCNLKNATIVGSVVQGGGKGVEFVLKKRKPYYFACGVGAGIHCKVGLMKFSVRPTRPCRG